MKRIVGLMLVFALLLSGCSWLDGEYHSVTAHAEDVAQQSQDGFVITSYTDLRDAVLNMVSSGIQKRTFYFPDSDTNEIEYYIDATTAYVKNNSAIGAYAVDDITYESGTMANINALVIEISYLHSRQEILRIMKAPNINSAKKLISSAMRSCSANTVVLVSDYEYFDVTQYVQDYVDQYPDVCMEMPQVSVDYYPDSGKERIMEITFSYQTSRELLRAMQEKVSPIFSASKLYVQGSENTRQKYEQLFSFLMERFDYQYDTSINPSYSLLRFGVGDSKAFATVYSFMCRNAEIPCDVVVGSRNGEAWYWNRVKVDGEYYHLDLLAADELGEFILTPSEEMLGYVWDYSVYP